MNRSWRGDPMTKFRKKPVVIEAVQFSENTRTEAERITEWVNSQGGNARCGIGSSDSGYAADLVFITTLEGVMKANPFDWIIRGIKGEFYPCRDDIFEATYEPVSEVPCVT